MRERVAKGREDEDERRKRGPRSHVVGNQISHVAAVTNKEQRERAIAVCTRWFRGRALQSRETTRSDKQTLARVQARGGPRVAFIDVKAETPGRKIRTMGMDKYKEES